MTTGSCATAAATAAARVLAGLPPPPHVEIELPDGGTACMPIRSCEGTRLCARASVIKDAGDDPDITDGVTVEVTLRVMPEGDLTFVAGPGIGRVTKPGLALSPGEPAINPVPRRTIATAIRKTTRRPVEVTVSIPGGETLAARTFNSRLGIRGGLSILGTTGIVRPFSLKSVQETIRCSLSVAFASGLRAVVLVPGNMGRRAAHRIFRLAEEQVVEIGNEWGFSLDAMKTHPFSALLALGHPGKLAKLAVSDWDTHSSRSRSAVAAVRSLPPNDLVSIAPDAETVEALFDAIPACRPRAIGDRLAEAIRQSIRCRHADISVAVLLINLKGEAIGRAGDFAPWKEHVLP
ncbi:MAG: cobalt-precorrin-5B (C(1))-methyltransferase CbiD [Verrucomicrobiota bacterium]|nr:cobalt-precorrin-5B (C(1))-methyltransferase CbiD [Verrucomicrobiota bacterium]